MPIDRLPADVGVLYLSEVLFFSCGSVDRTIVSTVALFFKYGLRKVLCICLILQELILKLLG